MWSSAEYGDDVPSARPPFGADGQLWFREWCENRIGVVRLSDTLRDLVLDLLCARACVLVHWVAEDHYQGPDRYNGAWKVKADAWSAAFDACVAEATRAVEAARDAKHCTSLDAWLAAEATGALSSCGAIGGSKDLPVELQNRLFDAACKRRKRWPKRCRGCGDSFTPCRRQAVHCPNCRAAKASTRCDGGAARRAAGQDGKPSQLPTVPHREQIADIAARVQGQLDEIRGMIGRAREE